ncbi:MAG: flagellar basal body P-ring formation chaperone FlgA [Deferribacteraceae bacterium]|jgi:flagella basal body P-ring formation protein FlgA|nr:flagellar basal body P-ring formation chaperone FlgA [Deferribacteraceae bacterium]
MIRQIWLFALLIALSLSFSTYGQAQPAGSIAVPINSDCVQLKDLFGIAYPPIKVQCGFMPGDEKPIPAGAVAALLRRNALPVPDMPESFTVIRAGKKLDSEGLRKELEALYKAAHADKTIAVESIRLTREVYIAAGANYELVVDTDKFGSGYGSLVSGDVKINFSYTVKVYEQGYVISAGLRAGDELAGAVQPELIDITNLRSPLVHDIDGLVAARSATRGKVLTVDLVQTRPERNKGDRVTLIYTSGKIRLEIDCIAEASAVVGKTFPVRNPSSGRVFTAVYLGEGLAEAK